jgi:DNA-directed RNA polymerase subunit E'/Rpb7
MIEVWPERHSVMVVREYGCRVAMVTTDDIFLHGIQNLHDSQFKVSAHKRRMLVNEPHTVNGDQR